MAVVPAVRTPFTPRALCDALEAAWRPELGGDPLANKGTLAVLAAQVALETGNGASCWNNNPGNYKASAGVDAMPLRTTERLKNASGQLVTVGMTCMFASYPTLADGVERFLRAQYTSWPGAWKAACAGDPRGYAMALAAQHPPYYTADPELYAKGVEAWFVTYAKLFAGDPAPTQPALEAFLPQLDLVDQE